MPGWVRVGFHISLGFVEDMFKNHDHILFVLLFEVIELLSQVGDLPRLPFVLFA